MAAQPQEVASDSNKPLEGKNFIEALQKSQWNNEILRQGQETLLTDIFSHQTTWDKTSTAGCRVC